MQSTDTQNSNTILLEVTCELIEFEARQILQKLEIQCMDHERSLNTNFVLRIKKILNIFSL